MFRKLSYDEHQGDLDAACRWLGIERGRALQYGKLLEKLYKKNRRSTEHILAYAESCEIVDVYKLWERRIDDFPGLYEKIRAALRKGPLLREYEKPAVSSNRPRNDAFVYIVAGTFFKAGIRIVAVEGVPARHAASGSKADCTFECGGCLIDVECKRPQSDKKLVPLVKKALQQITSTSRRGRRGVIALDCSVLVRPAGHLLERESPEAAEPQISSWLEEKVLPGVIPCLTNSILGCVLFARVPAMIRLGNDEPSRRRDCVSAWLVYGDALRCIAKRLDEAVDPS